MKIKTKVRVLKANDGSWSKLHEGIVVASTNSFVKVWDTKSDNGPDTAEWFPIEGKLIKTVAVNDEVLPSRR
jgi:hypothetical protein